MVLKRGWQFPDNNCTKNYGLEDADTETFAGDSDGGLAREICQNSIDANNRKGKPTRVEFSKFTINTIDIPGYQELKNEIEACYEYKGEDLKEGKQLKLLKETINNEKIECLRISDFNTTGLIGILDDENDSPFFLLTKGSGTSGKTEGNGGSKGIGKYACFVASNINTVFYSTKAFNEEKNREEVGYIGISKLRSRPIQESSRHNLMTMGTGYFASNIDNAPIHEELSLDPSFMRGDEDYGTDVYLIGYSSQDWVSNITYKILEGFMGAIIFNGFEVKVGNQIINKDTISGIIDSNLFDLRSSSDRRYLKAQFSLFDAEGVQKREFTIGKDSKITVYVRTYNQKNESEASKRCEFIRYPYMRIKKLSIQTLLPYSAMCIIENNELCEKLRSIEDPAHTQWQFDRLTKFGNLTKRDMVNLSNEMEGKVRDFIHECLQQDMGDKIDFEGASEFLPADESDVNGSEESAKDGISTTPVRRVHISTPKTVKSSENGMGPEFSTGSPDGFEEGFEFPAENHDIPNPNPNTKPLIDDNRGKKDGDTPAILKAPLGGMRFKTIYNSLNNCIDVIFVSKFNVENCELYIREVGLNDDRYDVNIMNATLDGNACVVENGVIKNFSIKEGVKYKFSCKTSSEERFASEVVLNAISGGDIICN